MDFLKASDSGMRIYNVDGFSDIFLVLQARIMKKNFFRSLFPRLIFSVRMYFPARPLDK